MTSACICKWTYAVALIVSSALMAGCSNSAPTSTPAGSNSTPSVTSPSDNTPQLPAPPRPDESYVGSSACAECHAEIAQRYQSHPMAHSLTTVSAASPLEKYDATATFRAGPCEYQVEKNEDRIIHHERLIVDDKVLYDQAEEVTYALGSGTRGRSYLIDRGGVMFMSPVGWYAGKSWDLSPGYTPGRHQRFGRRVTSGCLQCHAGHVQHERDRPDFFPSPTFIEPSIGCERCHGPGERHIAFHRDDSSKAGEPDPIVNPVKLPHVEREAVCYQCHLQATDRILRYGRDEFDFRPGQKINDVWTVFLSGIGIEASQKTAVVSQVEQMQSSRCFAGSQGQLGCISCHDPHSSPAADDRMSFYQGRCLECHLDQGCSLDVEARNQAPAQGSCIHCHMPRLEADVVPHTTQTDHRILRQPGILQHSGKGPLTIFQEEGFELSEVELTRARGLMLIRMVEGSGRLDLAREAESMLLRASFSARDDGEILEALGVLQQLLGDTVRAEKYWHERLARTPDNERTLFRLASVAHDTGRFVEARDLFAQLLRLNPAQPIALGRQAHVLGQLGEYPAGIESAKRGLELDPTLLPVYGWLAEAWKRQGNDAESQRLTRLRQQIQQAFSRP